MVFTQGCFDAIMRTGLKLTSPVLWIFVSRGGVCESHDLVHWQLQLLWLQWHWAERWVGWEEVTEVIPRKQVTPNSACQELYKWTSNRPELHQLKNCHVSKRRKKRWLNVWIFVSKDEHGIEKIPQTFTRQSGRPTIAAVADEEASSSVSESDSSRVFNGWHHRGKNLLVILSYLNWFFVTYVRIDPTDFNVDVLMNNCSCKVHVPLSSNKQIIAS